MRYVERKLAMELNSISQSRSENSYYTLVYKHNSMECWHFFVVRKKKQQRTANRFTAIDLVNFDAILQWYIYISYTHRLNFWCKRTHKVINISIQQNHSLNACLSGFCIHMRLESFWQSKTNFCCDRDLEKRGEKTKMRANWNEW